MRTRPVLVLLALLAPAVASANLGNDDVALGFGVRAGVAESDSDAEPGRGWDFRVSRFVRPRLAFGGQLVHADHEGTPGGVDGEMTSVIGHALVTMRAGKPVVPQALVGLGYQHVRLPGSRLDDSDGAVLHVAVGSHFFFTARSKSALLVEYSHLFGENVSHGSIAAGWVRRIAE